MLSGNRNFEARIHPNLKANFLASPPLVVAYAIAGTVLKDLTSEPLGTGSDGKPVFLRDIWPSSHEIAAVLPVARDAATYPQALRRSRQRQPAVEGDPRRHRPVYDWPASTYIAKPPFFDAFSMQPTAAGSIRGARALGIFGDSVTTDHISPGGLDQGQLARRPVADREQGVPRRTSTATAAGAATTKS